MLPLFFGVKCVTQIAWEHVVTYLWFFLDQYNQVDEEDVNSPTKAKITTKLVLEMDKEKEPLIEVWPNIIRKLKPHQVEVMCNYNPRGAP